MASNSEISAIKARSNIAEESRLDEGFASIVDKLQSRSITFSKKEQEILDTYDALQEMRLENAMMEAQINQENPRSRTESKNQTLETAEQEHLEARSAYALSESIVKNVLQVDPLLKAIHSGENASARERSLQPLIDQRDILSLVQTNLSTRLQSVNNDLLLVRARSLEHTEKNKALSVNIVRLGKQAEITADKVEDPALKERLEVLKASTREERRKYRIVKSLASGVVAGSGFDWAADDELRDIVLDDED